MSNPTGPQDPYGTQPPSGGYGAPPPPPSGGYGVGPTGTPPPNYLVWAIISVFLCWPLAIPAIVFSTQVNTKWAQGDVAGAQNASSKAKTFSLWATILGAIGIILYVVLIAAGVMAGVTEGTTSY